MGRIDDVLNVSGHRLSTMEIESSLVSHKDVAEAAVVGKPDDIKGEVIHCFVVLQESCKEAKDSMSNALEAHVCKQIGAIAKPECIHFTESLPKTRSGKIMRRLLRDIAAGRETTGDISTLEDKNALESLKVTR
jgi:acetyl-CoA synthetase